MLCPIFRWDRVSYNYKNKIKCIVTRSGAFWKRGQILLISNHIEVLPLCISIKLFLIKVLKPFSFQVKWTLVVIVAGIFRLSLLLVAFLRNLKRIVSELSTYSSFLCSLFLCTTVAILQSLWNIPFLKMLALPIWS